MMSPSCRHSWCYRFQLPIDGHFLHVCRRQKEKDELFFRIQVSFSCLSWPFSIIVSALGGLWVAGFWKETEGSLHIFLESAFSHVISYQSTMVDEFTPRDPTWALVVGTCSFVSLCLDDKDEFLIHRWVALRLHSSRFCKHTSPAFSSLKKKKMLLFVSFSLSFFCPAHFRLLFHLGPIYNSGFPDVWTMKHMWLLIVIIV